MATLDVFNRILVCADFSRSSLRAFEYALALCSANPEAQLCLFHAIPEPDAQFWKTYLYEIDQIDDKAKADIDRKLQECYLDRAPKGLTIRTRVDVGSAAERLLEAVQAESIDLVVLGREDSGGPSTLFWGDSVRSALRKLRCPVLVIPPESD